MSIFIVWNENKTEAFVTPDKQLAYEVRKSAESNCYDSKGNHWPDAQKFCEKFFNENCTIEEII